MTKLQIELPDSVFSNLHQTTQELSQEIQLFAAAKWYNMGKISLPQAVEMTGLTYQEFVRTLSRLSMSPFKNSTAKKEALRKATSEHNAQQIMKYAGSWSDMPEADFQEFLLDIEKHRQNAFILTEVNS
jgi:predicted HTH domain antitoxin